MRIPRGSASTTPTRARKRARRTRQRLWLTGVLALSMPLGLTATAGGASADEPQLLQFEQEFLELYEKIKDPANGYFSDEGIPYHSVETLIVEAPDHGHETTSEAYSYL
ncbi:endoglucanase, partial [Streptomyces sp. 8K308]|uniref:glycoside hydrolase family 48 protein n=1 Tax=Streptomyces sp. 8K308 TaxID=2530388 RepID=UPI0010D3F644